MPARTKAAAAPIGPTILADPNASNEPSPAEAAKSELGARISDLIGDTEEAGLRPQVVDHLKEALAQLRK